MSDERDEFEALHDSVVKDAKSRPEYRNPASLSGYSEGVEHAIETMRLRGYRKPRIITTFEELDALGDGSVILDKDDDVSQRRGGLWCGYETAALKSVRVAKYLPAVVLREPQP